MYNKSRNVTCSERGGWNDGEGGSQQPLAVEMLENLLVSCIYLSFTFVSCHNKAKGVLLQGRTLAMI